MKTERVPIAQRKTERDRERQRSRGYATISLPGSTPLSKTVHMAAAAASLACADGGAALHSEATGTVQAKDWQFGVAVRAVVLLALLRPGKTETETEREG